MAEKAYCKRCTFYSTLGCNHPSNKKDEVVQDWFDHRIEAVYLTPARVINKNNDCPHFEGV